jgi:hypothetical protein
MSVVTEALVHLADWALTLWPWGQNDKIPDPPPSPDQSQPTGQAPTSVPPAGHKPTS